MPQAQIAGYRPGECFVGAARKASRRLTQFYDDALEPCGLRSTQYTILAELGRFPRQRWPNWLARSFPTVRRSATI